MMWCNDYEKEVKRSEFVKRQNITKRRAVCARKSNMQGKFRRCKDDANGFTKYRQTDISKISELIEKISPFIDLFRFFRCLAKRVLNARFLSYLDKFGPLHGNQFGFRKINKPVDALA